MASLLDRVVGCEQADRSLLVGARGRHTVAALIDYATRHRVTHLVAASRSGERLVGAMLTAADGNLELWAPESGGSVLVVEGPAAGDSAVRQVVARVSPHAVRVRAVIVGDHLDVLSEIADLIDIAGLRLSA